MAARSLGESESNRRKPSASSGRTRPSTQYGRCVDCRESPPSAFTPQTRTSTVESGAEGRALECPYSVAPRARLQDSTGSPGGLPRVQTAQGASDRGRTPLEAAARSRRSGTRVPYRAIENATLAPVVSHSIPSLPPLSLMSRKPMVNWSTECSSLVTVIGARATSNLGS